MMGRLIIYYSLLIPWGMLFLFGPEFLQLVFEMFLILATIMVPYSEDFVRRSLRGFPGFLLLSLVIFTFLIMASDFVIFASDFSPYLSLLIIVPLYSGFRLLSYPWRYIEKGLSPRAYLKTDNQDNWLILAVVSALAIVYYFSPVLVFFLAPVASFFIYSNLRSIQV